MTMADRTARRACTGHTVVGVFDGQSDAEKALNELKDAGFTPDQVSVVAKDTRETQTMVERSDMGGAETSRRRHRRAARRPLRRRRWLADRHRRAGDPGHRADRGRRRPGDDAWRRGRWRSRPVA